jgi:hypothetical protein
MSCDLIVADVHDPRPGYYLCGVLDLALIGLIYPSTSRFLSVLALNFSRPWDFSNEDCLPPHSTMSDHCNLSQLNQALLLTDP